MRDIGACLAAVLLIWCLDDLDHDLNHINANLATIATELKPPVQTHDAVSAALEQQLADALNGKKHAPAKGDGK